MDNRDQLGLVPTGLKRDLLLLGLGVAAFGLSLIPSVLNGHIGIDWVVALLGFVILWLSGFVSLLFQQRDLERDSRALETKIEAKAADLEGTIAASAADVAKLVGIQHYDPVFLDEFAALSRMAKDMSANHHLRRHFELELDQFLQKSRQDLLLSSCVFYSKDDEGRRMARLDSVIDDARNYIFAVTYDFNDYLTTWSFRNQQYVQYLHKQAARQGEVNIQRILVLGEDVMAGDKPSRKRREVDRIVTEHRAAGLDIHVVPHAEIANRKWNIPQAGFLVCDDNVTSMSYHLNGAGECQDGWVKLNDRNEIEMLKQNFDRLRGLTTTWPLQSA